jgi:hypothetical protein
MRTLLQVELDTETANKLLTDGSIGKTMDEVMGALKPEAAYFYTRNGHRTMTFVVDAADEASLVTMCEPFWQAMNAQVDAFICMNAEDLRHGLERLG